MASYLIVGSGRAAHHFSHYFQLIQLNFETWNRHEPWALLQTRLEKATHVLLLISDSALESFFQNNQPQANQIWIHFSGALEIPGMVSAHPLMTFSKQLYDLEAYQKIPFVLTADGSLSELLPGLENQSYQIRPEQKPMYHALCVIGGNLTTLLWQKMSQGFEQLELPSEILLPYMRQIFSNLQSDLHGSLTGPFARKDAATVRSHLAALKDDRFRPIYQAFVEVYFPEIAHSPQSANEKRMSP